MSWKVWVCTHTASLPSLEMWFLSPTNDIHYEVIHPQGSHHQSLVHVVWPFCLQIVNQNLFSLFTTLLQCKHLVTLLRMCYSTVVHRPSFGPLCTKHHDHFRISSWPSLLLFLAPTQLVLVISCYNTFNVTFRPIKWFAIFLSGLYFVYVLLSRMLHCFHGNSNSVNN